MTNIILPIILAAFATAAILAYVELLAIRKNQTKAKDDLYNLAAKIDDLTKENEYRYGLVEFKLDNIAKSINVDKADKATRAAEVPKTRKSK